MLKKSDKKNTVEKPFSEMTAKEKGKEILSWIIWLSAAIIIAVMLRTFVFEFAVVSGDSMNNTLYDKEYVFVEKISKLRDDYEYGDILIVHYPGSSAAYVKRLVGKEGDTIEVKDGYLYRNGAKTEEPYTKDEYINFDFEKITVPSGHVFVMGDNRNNSMDSRNPSVGPIAEEEIVGHASFVMLPISGLRGLK